ncbi:MAG: outer membrane protein transport protein [Pirellulales bacterium]
MFSRTAGAWAGAFLAVAAVVAGGSPVAAQGVILPGVGPVNRSMSGAATAAPLDAAGAIHWNPATIGALETNEILFGVEFVDSQTELASTIPANAFGPGVPGATLYGNTDSNSGIRTLPTVALVWRPDDSPWTFGLAALGIGGFGVDYAASKTNPILTAQPPSGFGAGPLYSRLGILQIVPTASLQLTQNFSVGFAPTFSIADLQLDPFFLAPDDADGNGFPTYPRAVNTRNFWGLGFQVGAYLTTDSDWNFGVSYKSKQWFEKFRFNSEDELGNPTTLIVSTQLPSILSVGTSYTGYERLLLAFDVRYIDYAGTPVFGDPVGFTPTGASTGLGWRSVLSFVPAAQYILTDNISLRASYMYNQNPIPASATSANIQSSALYEHSMALGASMNLNASMVMHFAWVHSFDLTSTGDYLTPAGPIPGGSVSIHQVNNALTMGVTVKF